MKKLSVLFLFWAAVAHAQSGQISYAPSCTDSIRTEDDRFCSECGEHYFFGGAQQFKRFLQVNLAAQIRKGEIPAGTISVTIRIDTLGQTQSIAIASPMSHCAACNQTILNAMKTIRRWKPPCYYLIAENRVVCEEKDLAITIVIRDQRIFLLTDE